MRRGAALLALPGLAAGGCMMNAPGGAMREVPAGHPMVPGVRRATLTEAASWAAAEPGPQARRARQLTAVAQLDVPAVKADIIAQLKVTPKWAEGDSPFHVDTCCNGNYGPFFVRLAWHCSGSYRVYDGRGGCDGGRIRFDPERSWADNANLEFAAQLLWPIKTKYGTALSWGDLIVLAGTTAIESMGFPFEIPFCAGRVDDEDGSESYVLDDGPTNKLEHGIVQELPSTARADAKIVKSLIYVHPPTAQPIDVKTTFANMGMNDSETVALIGGGHAFGRTHGNSAQKNTPGCTQTDRANIGRDGYHGTGSCVHTSGFEGPWTANPTVWDNSYFTGLKELNWTEVTGPSGNKQWVSDDGQRMMLRADVVLYWDATCTTVGPPGGGLPAKCSLGYPDGVTSAGDNTGIGASYRAIVDEYAADQSKLERAFAAAWYKLVSRDRGWLEDSPGHESSCVTTKKAPPTPVDFAAVAKDIKAMLTTDQPGILAADRLVDDQPHYGALFIRLAWHCSGNYRNTDHRGGCNGARIRFPPQSEWADNAALDKAWPLLQGVKDKYGDGLSWADLIVLAGTAAIEAQGGRAIPFCGGRTDAPLDEGPGGSAYLGQGPADALLTGSSAQLIYIDPHLAYDPAGYTAQEMRRTMSIMGFTEREMVVLNGGGHSVGQTHADRTGFGGRWTFNPTTVSNSFFQTLLEEQWEETTSTKGHKMFTDSRTKSVFMLPTDMVFRDDPKFKAIVQEYAADNELFLDDFAIAWAKLVNADRHGTACPTTFLSAPPATTPAPPPNGGGGAPATPSGSDSSSDGAMIAGWVVAGVAVLALLTVLFLGKKKAGPVTTPDELGTQANDSAYARTAE